MLHKSFLNWKQPHQIVGHRSWYIILFMVLAVNCILYPGNEYGTHYTFTGISRWVNGLYRPHHIPNCESTIRKPFSVTGRSSGNTSTIETAGVQMGFYNLPFGRCFLRYSECWTITYTSILSWHEQYRSDREELYQKWSLVRHSASDINVRNS